MVKAPLDISGQIALLRSRALPVDGHEDRLLRLLIDNNYYRLSGYWRYFQYAPHLGDNRFLSTATVDTIIDVYVFDGTLRSLLLEGLAEFEVSFRSRLAYYISTCQASCTYLIPSTYRTEIVNGVNLAAEVVDCITDDLKRSRERAIEHHRRQGEDVPVWAAVEVLSFGTVSKMYRQLADNDVAYKVAKSFGFPDPDFTASVTRSFSVLRNICAHHGRIWNRRPDAPMRVLKALKTDLDRDIYHQTPWAWLVMLAHVVDALRHDASYSAGLWALVDSHPEFHDGLRHPHTR